jgi:hypothetical protein
MAVITLNEAIRLLMNEPKRLARAELAEELAQQKKLRNLVSVFWHELNKLSEGQSFLIGLIPEHVRDDNQATIPMLGFWPPERIIARLGRQRRGWHPSVKALHQAAREVRDARKAYDRRYSAAAHKLFEGARLSHVALYGNTIQTTRQQVELIKTSYFFNKLEIDKSRTIIGSKLFSRDNRADLPVSFRDVVVDEGGVLRWAVTNNLNSPMPDLRRRAKLKTPNQLSLSPETPDKSKFSAHSQSDLELFFKTYADKHDSANSKPPGREADQKALKEAFPNIKALRATSRELRQLLRPAWTLRGRRRKSAAK